MMHGGTHCFSHALGILGGESPAQTAAQRLALLTLPLTPMQVMKPKDFAQQINLNMDNCWGIVRALVDLCMKQEDGKYLLVKDPNKQLLRLYSVPEDAFQVGAAPSQSASATQPFCRAIDLSWMVCQNMLRDCARMRPRLAVVP